MGRIVDGTVVPSWQESGRAAVASEREASGLEYAVRWFAWREVRLALAYGRAGGIALHRFSHDLRRFGLGATEPACHMLSVDRALLIDFAARFGLRAAWIEPPRPRRPDIWHFDVFGTILHDLESAYPFDGGAMEIVEGMTLA